MGQGDGQVPGFFAGTHIKKIDAKGRVSVPPSFRACLGEAIADGVYAMRSISGDRALNVFPSARFTGLAANIQKPFDPEDVYLATAIFGESLHLAFDAEGRVTLPDEFRAFAGIEGEVCFIGLGIYFQMWEPGAGHARQEEARLQAERNRDRISLDLSGFGEGSS